MLSDVEIKQAMNGDGGVSISPRPHDDSIQPASVDLHLSDKPLIILPAEGVTVPWLNQSHELDDRPFDVTISGRPSAILEPGEFALASTIEKISFGPGYSGQLEGKSSLARLGLVVHVTAGFFDPGFSGHPTLELVNLSPRRIALTPEMPIAQMCFFRMDTPAEYPYDERGHYVDQGPHPVPSRYHQNFHRAYSRSPGLS